MARGLVPLRDYQQRGLEALLASIAAGSKAPLLVYPTGAGKTILALHGMVHFMEQGKDQLFIAPRRKLVTQTQNVVFKNGGRAGVLMAGVRRDRFAPIQIATKQTLQPLLARGIIPKAQIIWIDEAHLSISGGFEKILSYYPNAIKIGLTATPARTDGRGLGEIFDDLILGPSIGELIEQGHLVPLLHFSCTAPDLKGVRSVGGDYDSKQLGERCDNPKLVGEVVRNWLRLGEGRKTIIFNVNIAHSLHVVQAFNAIGIKAEHVDGTMPDHERDPIMQRFEQGDTQILSCCQLIEYGVDIPVASCIVLNKPTKSLTRYLQAAGRGTRLCDGKHNTLILDHGDNVRRLGLVYATRDWSLDGKEKISDREARKKDKKDGDEPKTLTCINPECGCKFEARQVVDGKNCPNCGAQVIFKKPEPVEYIPADLVAVEKAPVLVSQMSEKEQFYRELLWETRKRGWSDGAAAHNFKRKYGCWPTFKKVPLPPKDNAARAWIDAGLRSLRYGGQRTKEARRNG